MKFEGILVLYDHLFGYLKANLKSLDLEFYSYTEKSFFPTHGGCHVYLVNHCVCLHPEKNIGYRNIEIQAQKGVLLTVLTVERFVLFGNLDWSNVPSMCAYTPVLTRREGLSSPTS